MTFEEARGNLKDLELREFAYNHAAGMLYFDGVTAAPKGTYVSRGKTLSVLNEEIYKLSSSEAAHETLKVLAEHMDELTEPERRLVQLREKALRFRSRVPMDEYVAYQELLNEAATVWREAKGRSDFAMFEPLLQKIVEASRRFAALVEPEKDPYDFWLDNYEEGMTQEFCDSIAIIHHGQIVLSGKLSEIKRQYGQNRLMLSSSNYGATELKSKLQAEFSDILTVSGMTKTALILNKVQDIGTNDIMRRIADSDIEIYKFGSYEPSLGDIFVDKAGDEE